MKKGNKDGKTRNSFTLGTFDPISYIFGRTQHFLEVYAAGNGLSPVELAAGLATLLLATSNREVLGTVNHLPALRGTSTKVDSSSRSLAMDGKSHRKAQVRKGAHTKATAVEVLEGFSEPKDVQEVAAEMMRVNSSIASQEAAAQCLYKMKKTKELLVNKAGQVKLAA